jgi:hypothetical protein
MPEYLMAMSPEEMTEFLESEFYDLEDNPKRCIATMMAMLMDHNEFLEEQGLEEKFDFLYDNNEGDLH